MIINELPNIMIKCLICTIVIEILIGLILKIRDKKDILNIALVNIVTNPIVTSVPVYFNVMYGVIERNIYLIVLEFITLIVEGLFYKKYLKYNKLNPFVISLILNFSSYIVGDIINKF